MDELPDMRGSTMGGRTETLHPRKPEPDRDRKESETAAGLEEVETGIGEEFQELDDHGEPIVTSRPKPRGLIPVPPEVEAVVAREQARLWKDHGIIPTPEARQRMVDSLTLQYYFDGIDIAYRRTPEGVEVVAVGLDEVGELIRTTPQGQREGVVFGQG
jgi:hypothetical protein